MFTSPAHVDESYASECHGSAGPVPSLRAVSDVAQREAPSSEGVSSFIQVVAPFGECYTQLVGELDETD